MIEIHLKNKFVNGNQISQSLRDQQHVSRINKSKQI